MDVVAVSSEWSSGVVDVVCDGLGADVTRSQVLEWVKDPSVVSRVAVDGFGEVAGAALVRRVSGDVSSELVALSVRSGVRSQGVGSLLVSDVLSACSGGVTCEVEAPGSVSADARLRFYGRFGAVVVDDDPDTFCVWLPPVG